MWGDNIEFVSKATEYKGVDWIQLQLRALWKTTISLRLL